MTMQVVDQSQAPVTTPAAPAAPAVARKVVLPGGSLSSLHTQLNELNVQLAGQRAQWNG